MTTCLAIMTIKIGRHNQFQDCQNRSVMGRAAIVSVQCDKPVKIDHLSHLWLELIPIKCMLSHSSASCYEVLGLSHMLGNQNNTSLNAIHRHDLGYPFTMLLNETKQDTSLWLMMKFFVCSYSRQGLPKVLVANYWEFKFAILSSRTYFHSHSGSFSNCDFFFAQVFMLAI